MVPATRLAAKEKRLRFAREYLIDLNGTQAAIRAGYSPRGARVTAHRLLRSADVAAMVKQAMDERARRVGVTADELLAELKAIILSRQDDYEVGKDGSLRLREGVQAGAMGAVASFKRRIRRTITTVGKGKKQRRQQEEVDDAELRLWNKVEAIGLGMRHLKLIGDHEQGGGGVEKVFLLPVVALNAEEWQRQVAERRALPAR